jgi:hypothetical protein
MASSRPSAGRGVVVGREFGQRQPLGPVILNVVNVGTDVLFHDGVNPLSMTVNLWVEGGGKPSIDTQARRCKLVHPFILTICIVRAAVLEGMIKRKEWKEGVGGGRGYL